MPIEFGTHAVFLDVVVVDDAEALLQWHQITPHAKADLSRCTHMHPANLQVLMATQMEIVAWPEDRIWRSWLLSALQPDFPSRQGAR